MQIPPSTVVCKHVGVDCACGHERGGWTFWLAMTAISLLRQRWVRDSLNCPVDIAIATPESLLRYRHREQVKLSDVRHLVIDEADTMFDASFLNSALSILRSVQVRIYGHPEVVCVCALALQSGCAAHSHDKGCRKEPPVAGQGAQVILVAATLSHELLSVARQHVLALKKVTSKDLHRVLPHVEQVFLAVEAQEKAGVCVPAHWPSLKAASVHAL